MTNLNFALGSLALLSASALGMSTDTASSVDYVKIPLHEIGNYHQELTFSVGKTEFRMMFDTGFNGLMIPDGPDMWGWENITQNVHCKACWDSYGDVRKGDIALKDADGNDVVFRDVVAFVTDVSRCTTSLCRSGNFGGSTSIPSNYTSDMQALPPLSYDTSTYRYTYVDIADPADKHLRLYKNNFQVPDEWKKTLAPNSPSANYEVNKNMPRLASMKVGDKEISFTNPTDLLLDTGGGPVIFYRDYSPDIAGLEDSLRQNSNVEVKENCATWSGWSGCVCYGGVSSELVLEDMTLYNAADTRPSTGAILPMMICDDSPNKDRYDYKYVQGGAVTIINNPLIIDYVELQDMVDTSRSPKPEPKCANDGDQCGGPGKQTLPCCDSNSECKTLVGGSNMVCQPKTPEPQCKNNGEQCGGPGQQTLPCCDSNSECKTLIGGSNMVCQSKTPEPQCKNNGEQCGGPGQQTLPCCDSNSKCKTLIGGSNMVCQ